MERIKAKNVAEMGAASPRCMRQTPGSVSRKDQFILRGHAITQ